MILIRKLKSFYGFIKVRYLYKNHITLKGKINISGIPVLVFKDDGKLILGNNVSLKSNKKNYHLNMYSSVKLMVDKQGALISIGDNTRINGSCIHAYKKIIIGKNCLISANCQIIDGNGHELSFTDVKNRINTIGEPDEVIIEDNVWIGTNCIILPGVKIGYGSVVAAGSVVTQNIPSMCIAGGNPAKMIKQY